MGYYSSVALTMKTEDITAILNKAKSHMAREKDAQTLDELLANPDVVVHGDGYISLCWECVKWYKDFYVVRQVKAQITAARKAGRPYSFKRAGSEYDDLEIDTSIGAKNDYDVGNKSEILVELIVPNGCRDDEIKTVAELVS